MNSQDGMYWSYLIGGNVAYFLVLELWWMLLKRARSKQVVISVVMLAAIAGPVFVVVRTGMRLPGFVSGDYGDLSLIAVIIVEIVCFGGILLLMSAYQFFVFKLKLYQHAKERYVAYVYHDQLLLLSWGVWCIVLFTPMFVAGAMSEHYDLSWGRFHAPLLALGYLGGICMMLVRDKTFVVEKGTYTYKSFKASYQGKVADIRSIENVKNTIVLQAGDEKMTIRCSQKLFADLLSDKLSGGK